MWQGFQRISGGCLPSRLAKDVSHSASPRGVDDHAQDNYAGLTRVDEKPTMLPLSRWFVTSGEQG